MIRRQLISTLFLGALCSCSTLAHGAPIFTRDLVIDRSANIFKTEDFGLKIDFSNSFTTPVTNSLFTDVVVSPTTPAGTKFDFKPTDAGFAEVAAKLSDALNQAMRFVLTEKSSGRAEGRGYTQAQLFGKPPAAPDFAGKIINKIELVFNQFTLIPPPPPGSQPVSTGKPVKLDFTFNVYAVPEPASLGLMSVAALAALTVVRKRRG